MNEWWGALQTKTLDFSLSFLIDFSFYFEVGSEKFFYEK